MTLGVVVFSLHFLMASAVPSSPTVLAASLSAFAASFKAFTVFRSTALRIQLYVSALPPFASSILSVAYAFLSLVLPLSFPLLACATFIFPLLSLTIDEDIHYTCLSCLCFHIGLTGRQDD